MSDGSLIFDTKIDSDGFSKGTKNIKGQAENLVSTFNKLAAAVGIAFGVSAVVNFGKASVKASSELSNALTGLKSIMDGQGRSFTQAQSFINDYVSDGLIPATDAITAYKNLASRGYSDTQIKQTMLELKDAAAYGRQSGLSMGEAVKGAAEGLKNENSMLVDNAGVTKNVAKMWEDYAKSIGTTANNLTQQQKIQAEVNGIMEETKFQTGDAAKVAGGYSGQVLQMQYAFNQLEVALGNAIIPMAQVVLPVINTVISKLTDLFNTYAAVSAAIFGTQAKSQSNIATTADKAAQSTDKLASSTRKAASAAKGALASFDKINVLNSSDNSSTASTSGGTATPVTANPVGKQEIGSNVTVSPKLLATISRIEKLFEPVKKSLSGLADALKPLKTFVAVGLDDFYNNFLKPIGSWVLGEGLPRFIDAISNGLQNIDFGKINTALSNLWTALTPFAINVGEGLLWFWENVLVPLGTWTMNNVVPLFIDGLKLSIERVNAILIIFKPVALWLFENFLKPIAKWTGGIIISILSKMNDHFSNITDWMLKHKATVKAMTGIVIAFFAAWKVANVLSFIQTSGGVIAALKKITTALFATQIAQFKSNLEARKSVLINAKDFVISAAKATAALAKQIATTVANTAVQKAAKVATIAGTIATVAATVATWAFNAALAVLTSPITLVVGAIVALIAIVVLLIKHWDKVKSTAQTVWTAIVNAVKVAVGGIKLAFGVVVAFFSGVWTGIKNVFSAVGTWFKTKFTGAVNNIKLAFGVVASFFGGVWTGIKNVFSAIGTWFKGKFDGAVSNIKLAFGGVGTFFGSIWTGIKTAFSGVTNWFKNVFSGAWEAVKGVFAAGGNVFKGIKANIGDVFRTVVDTLIDGINAVISAPFKGINALMNKIRDLKVVPDGLWSKDPLPVPEIPHLPKLATGTVVPANYGEFAAILGDNKRETEVVSPLSTIKKAVKEAFAEMSGYDGGDENITLIVELDGDVVYKKVVKKNKDNTMKTGVNALMY